MLNDQVKKKKEKFKKKQTNRQTNEQTKRQEVLNQASGKKNVLMKIYKHVRNREREKYCNK